MTSAAVADPELIRRPRHPRPRVAQLHVGAAAHAADMEIDVAHGGDFITWRRDPRDRARRRALVAHGTRQGDAADLAARFVINRDYDRGQLSSLVAGINAIDRPGVAAALVTLVDVPLVSAATVRAVIDHYRASRLPVVRPTSGARHGHPLLIDRTLFDRIRHADPVAGAKPVVRAHATAAGDLPIADEGAFTDIDTAEEYERLISGR
jgi:CTP:molybdopterin cytidylyltransferase MocA